MTKFVLSDEEQRKELVALLKKELDSRRDAVLEKASKLLGREITVSSLHGR